MKEITLKSRIIILLTTFTILSISIFILIQLSHEVGTVNKFIQHKATLNSLEIEEKFRDILSTPLSQEQKIQSLGKGLQQLKESQLIQKGYILDRSGRVIFSTEKWLSKSKGDYNDFAVINKLGKGISIRAETITDKAAKLFSVYIPLQEDGQISFLVRVFFPLGDIWRALRQVYEPAISVGILLIFINIGLGIFLSRLIIKPVGVFNEAAKKIASGRLDLRVNISTGDELQELAETFNFMTEELTRMKQKAENANPLTKLPGNIVIMEEVERKIKEGKKFTVIYCDLDNFKAFNDKYGIHKGDEAIMLTGNIFKEAVKAKGNSEDFIGHEGGDDFLLLTTPQRAQAIADYITSEFDQRVRSLYDKEDLERGCIVAHARDGSIKEFPIMTISLAGVTNFHRQINTYAEVTNIAAEVKKKAKKEVGSCFVIDKRKS